MPRRMNVPKLLDARTGESADMVWDFYGDVFPEKLSAILDITTHPDPFSPGSQRVCHHAAVQMWGLGVVDLGWCVTGEPDLGSPIAAVQIDPKLMFDLRDTMVDVSFKVSSRGGDLTNKMWVAYYHIVRLTAVAIAVKVCELSTRHRATDRFISASRSAEIDPNGMVVAWTGFSGVDLRQF